MEKITSQILVVFYSRAGQNWSHDRTMDLKVGNTEVYAKKIQTSLNADLFKIETIKNYPNGYYACCDMAKDELKKSDRPALKTHQSVASYDTIFLGFPIWWGTAPMAVFSFLKENDFKGKRVILFCTSEGSGFGTSIGDIKKAIPTAEVEIGLSLRGSDVDNSDEKIASWIQDL